MARDMRVAFKLSEEKKEELEEFANSYGVTMSALCALIIGQWLHQQKKVINPMVQAITEAMTTQLNNQDPKELEEMINMAKEQNRS